MKNIKLHIKRIKDMAIKTSQSIKKTKGVKT